MTEHIDSDPTPPHGITRYTVDLEPWHYAVIIAGICGIIAALILVWPALWTTAL